MLPYNTSISFTLDQCVTTTTVCFDESRERDSIEIYSPYSTSVKELFSNDASLHDKDRLLFQHIDRIRKIANIQTRVRVSSKNSFPTASGIASSASGFAALTLALVAAATRIAPDNAELQKYMADTAALSRLTRQSGSLSAMRSIGDGFVEATFVPQSYDCFSQTLAPPDHWKLCDLVVITEQKEKKISSLKGHLAAPSSPLFAKRIAELPERIHQCRKAIREKNFPLLGECMEADALSMHLVAMTSEPPLYYWNTATISLIAAVHTLREDGLACYYTIDAGANVHVICEQENAEKIAAQLRAINGVQQIIPNIPTIGAHLSDTHLF